MITAPYNFVPLNKEIYTPYWAELVSHDIPFKDGESGEIDITITAKSPIFIKDSKNEEQFCNHNGQYYIPSSSIKGVIRTISEIIGFSKLKLQDKTLSYRDLNNPSYKTKAMDTNKINMGWLYKNSSNQWIIENIGKVTNGQTRIKYDEMKNYLPEDIVTKIKDMKEAYKKYKLINFDKLKIDKGTIVFTGSTGNKTREFLFPSIEPIDVFTFSEDDMEIKTFKEAYYFDTPNESKDWKNLWKKRFKDGKRIPIFFQLNEENKIKHFGLSMLYKLPYEYSLQSILEKYQEFDNRKKDLSETMFGFIDDKEALKGRVNFSHFEANKSLKYNKTVSLPLSTPRATFYPNYLVQCGENGKTEKFITYDRLNSILRGFKLYPPRKDIITVAKNEKGEDFCIKNKNICTSFNPLDKGSIFKGKIRFHNLKKEELGLLLSSLSFLNQNKDEKYFHKIGMAKAYGFGTVSIKIDNLKTTNNKSIESYINSFIELLNKELKIDLLNHPRIKAFFKLSSYDYGEKRLKIMDINGFTNAKKDFNRFVLEEVVENAYDKSKICKKLNKKQNTENIHKSDKPKTSADLNNFFKNR
ncbi:TIGR03986 family CRISPR-associated RAMP protein [Aliarcobacter lanthieri]|uniref:TIGR03986 family type III CRISPR-associated RAMP protein n=1 Tax=Aliarcobacter lanthieri TaxID=1355374 RepID=UPI003AB09D43